MCQQAKLNEIKIGNLLGLDVISLKHVAILLIRKISTFTGDVLTDLCLGEQSRSQYSGAVVLESKALPILVLG